ncbi:cytochrome C oxidase subunit IV family protein [bacterium]|nr:cytochrome C oxidase subunit IV family protein [bacterium]
MSKNNKKQPQIQYQEGSAILHGPQASAGPALPAISANPFVMLQRIQGIFNTHEGDPKNVGHVVSLPLLTVVFLTLVFLTGVTYWVTFFDFGSLNLVIALLVALVKASLVVLYFMHMRWDRPMIPVVFIVSLTAVVLFIAFALIDTTTYKPEQIKGYAPDVPYQSNLK